MQRNAVFVLLLLLVSIAFARRYDDFKVVKINVSTFQQGMSLYEFLSTHPSLEFDVWATRVNFIEVMAGPDALIFLLEECSRRQLTYSIAIDDVQQLIEQEEAYNLQVQANPNAGFFDSYQNITQINDFLSKLAEQYPKLASVVQIGMSHEKRAILGLKISTSGSSNSSKPEIVYNGCQHAREWISPMTLCYIADTLLYNYTNNDPQAQQVLSSFDYMLVPVVNPDGYVYTQTDRLWRKNRDRYNNSVCIGVDNNRNWGWQWGTGGASPNSCSDTYQGPSAFSEPEETALSKYIANSKSVAGYIDFHSYSQLFMNPWGYTKQLPPDDAIQKQLSQGFVAAVLKVHHKAYKYGNVYTTVYPASGGSNDWTYGSPGIVYSFAVELRPETANQGGFLLPAIEIIPQGQEIMAGVYYMGQFITQNPKTPNPQ